MFDSATLSVQELAERWKKTPRQILDYAQSMGVPLYFLFDGLAFDVSDEWHRFGGDYFKSKKLTALRADIAHSEAWIARSAREENGKWEQQLTSKEAQELRVKIEADKRQCAALVEQLKQRDVARKKMSYRGLMRAAPQTLFEIARQSTTPSPHKAFHPQAPVKVVMLPGRGLEGATPIWDGRMMALEPFTDHDPWPPLTIDSLYAVTTEVKAIEEFLKAKQAAPEPQATTAKPLSRAAAQDSAILCEIKKLGHEPTNLPKNTPGKSGVKADIRKKLSNKPPFIGNTIFDKAWERLTKHGEIAYHGQKPLAPPP